MPTLTSLDVTALACLVVNGVVACTSIICNTIAQVMERRR